MCLPEICRYAFTASGRSVSLHERISSGNAESRKFVALPSVSVLFSLSTGFVHLFPMRLRRFCNFCCTSEIYASDVSFSPANQPDGEVDIPVLSFKSTDPPAIKCWQMRRAGFPFQKFQKSDELSNLRLIRVEAGNSRRLLTFLGYFCEF